MPPKSTEGRSDATSGSRMSFSRILLRKRSADPRTNSFGWLRSFRIMLQMRIISGSRLPSGERFSTASRYRYSSFFSPLSSLGTMYWMTFMSSELSCSPFSISMMIFLSVAVLVFTSELSSPDASSSVSARDTLSSKMRNVHCFSIAILARAASAAPRPLRLTAGSSSPAPHSLPAPPAIPFGRARHRATQMCSDFPYIW